VGRAALDHRKNRSEHAAHGADVLAVRIRCGRHREEMAEQLVGAVDQGPFIDQKGITSRPWCSVQDLKR
jgi:hypothetical protein